MLQESAPEDPTSKLHQSRPAQINLHPVEFKDWTELIRKKRKTTRTTSALGCQRSGQVRKIKGQVISDVSYLVLSL